MRIVVNMVRKDISIMRNLLFLDKLSVLSYN